MYKNGEGYNDPTAGAAMGQIMKEYRQQRRKEWQRETELKTRPKVYVVSRYAGDIDANVEAAKDYCRMVIQQKRIPVASHLLYPQILDDNVPEQREIGTMCGLALLAGCDEVWCFGTEHSPGMEKEISEAHRLKKPLRFFTERMQRTIQCQEGINQYGLLAKHPTTQMPIASPYFNMALQSSKQANLYWMQIYQIVKDNCETPIGGSNPNDDLMEKLLG